MHTPSSPSTLRHPGVRTDVLFNVGLTGLRNIELTFLYTPVLVRGINQVYLKQKLLCDLCL
jgi:hypothetical protein